MLVRVRPKLTYANVVATLALFIAIGGASAFAATQLAKNSVGPKQLKKNAVTTAKVKNEAITGAKVKKGTLTGTQINASTLGTVPTAQTADSVAPSEPWHEVGAAGEPQFENGCHGTGSNPEFGLATTAFYKDREGVVHLKGEYACGSIVVQAFQLPPGYRPSRNSVFPLPAGGGAILNVFGVSGLGINSSNAGGVYCWIKEPCFLNGITFLAES